MASITKVESLAATHSRSTVCCDGAMARGSISALSEWARRAQKTGGGPAVGETVN